MKIFDYSSGGKGKLLGESPMCHGHGSGTFLKGKPNNQEWIELDEKSAKDLKGNIISAEQYNVEKICFCMGELRCGTDATWHWVVSK